MFSGRTISDQPPEFQENISGDQKKNWKWESEKGKNLNKGVFNNQGLEIGIWNLETIGDSCLFMKLYIGNLTTTQTSGGIFLICYKLAPFFCFYFCKK